MPASFQAPRSVVPARARRLESPRGSGRVAEYAPHEWELVRGLVDAFKAGNVDARREFHVLHNLKVDLDARVFTADDQDGLDHADALEAEPEPLPLPADPPKYDPETSEIPF